MSAPHKPVFLDDTLNLFRLHAGEVRAAFDGTFGRGGHARAVLDAWPDCRMVAMDWDETAISFGRENFATEIASGRLTLIHASYESFALEHARRLHEPGFPQTYDLMLLDLGVSSPQLDTAERGFSFYHSGPLDMRMDQRQSCTASEIINSWDEQDLARLFIEYGEVQSPFRVVRAIVHDRKEKPFLQTDQLASLIERINGWSRKGSHPATQYFLALRLKVNEELVNLSKVLPQLINGLSPGGILSVITFHSLEDRIVKHLFKGSLAHGRLLNKKVIKPSELEVQNNPRARSAKLRAFEKAVEAKS
jgi:16S rRNA (cytosine1402-N4)-methyltransferase